MSVRLPFCLLDTPDFRLHDIDRIKRTDPFPLHNIFFHRSLTEFRAYYVSECAMHASDAPIANRLKLRSHARGSCLPNQMS